MAELKNCLLPDDLYYHVDFNVWARDLGDGTALVGMTDIAQTLAGSVIHCKPKAAGKKIKFGKSLATVESGKWVGPVKSPFTGEIVEVNKDVESDATTLNKSPYKSGWIVKIKPDDMAADLANLQKGADAVPGFEAYMEEKGLGECIHCEGFDG